MNVVVGSGWWCADSPPRWSIGSLRAKKVEFFDIWYGQVMRSIAPNQIFVTDSASPVKPNISRFANVTWSELDRNYGHAADIASGQIKTKYCGFTRSVLLGAMYALCCDAEWYVYVEQDCLLFGRDIIERAVDGRSGDIFLGQRTAGGIGLSGGPAADMYQQSLMIFRRSGIPRLINGVLSAPWTDGEVSPEETMRLKLEPFETIAIGYGRSRPINFDDDHLYVQHLNEGEFQMAMDRIDRDDARL